MGETEKIISQRNALNAVNRSDYSNILELDQCVEHCVFSRNQSNIQSIYIGRERSKVVASYRRRDSGTFFRHRDFQLECGNFTVSSTKLINAEMYLETIMVIANSSVEEIEVEDVKLLK